MIQEVQRIQQDLENKYKIGEQINKGSFGLVWKGYIVGAKNQLNTTVAIKPDQEIKYIKNEGLILQLCKNKNIIEYIDQVETQDYYYLIIQYCPISLKDYWKQFLHKQVDEKILIVILRQLVCGLHQIHRVGIIHRDLKLENIMLNISEDILEQIKTNKRTPNSIFQDNAQNLIKIIDFGISKNIEKTKLTKTVVGSPYTLAPQVLSQEFYGYEADIYSLGVNLYQLITGSFPYTCAEQQDQYAAIKQQGATLAGYPMSGELKDAILQMMKFSKEERLTFSQLYTKGFFQPDDVQIEEEDDHGQRTQFYKNESIVRPQPNYQDVYVSKQSTTTSEVHLKVEVKNNQVLDQFPILNNSQILAPPEVDNKSHIKICKSLYEANQLGTSSPEKIKQMKKNSTIRLSQQKNLQQSEEREQQPKQNFQDQENMLVANEKKAFSKIEMTESSLFLSLMEAQVNPEIISKLKKLYLEAERHLLLFQAGFYVSEVFLDDKIQLEFQVYLLDTVFKLNSILWKELILIFQENFYLIEFDEVTALCNDVQTHSKTIKQQQNQFQNNLKTQNSWKMTMIKVDQNHQPINAVGQDQSPNSNVFQEEYINKLKQILQHLQSYKNPKQQRQNLLAQMYILSCFKVFGNEVWYWKVQKNLPQPDASIQELEEKVNWLQGLLLIKKLQ